MKKHTSMKIVKQYTNVFCVGYADLQHLFTDEEPTYYNAGIYGWNCDLYTDSRTDSILCTGYRNTRGWKVPHDVVLEYDMKAKEILIDWSLSYDQTHKRLYELRCEFFDKIIKLKEEE